MSAIAPFKSEVRSRLDAVVELLSTGRTDVRLRDEARPEVDRIPEQIRRKFGVLDVGVPAIRELRGELPSA